MPQSFVCLYCHIIFSTKDREPLLMAEWRPRLHEYIGGILRSRTAIYWVLAGRPITSTCSFPWESK